MREAGAAMKENLREKFYGEGGDDDMRRQVGACFNPAVILNAIPGGRRRAGME